MNHFPTVVYKKNRWFIDVRLNQIRNVKRSNEWIEPIPIEIWDLQIIEDRGTFRAVHEGKKVY